jgi:molecular chaperone DnaJ
MFTTTCGRCRGQGGVIKDPCKTCSGAGLVERPRKVTVTFPAGIDAGQRLRVPGQGMPGPGGTPAGDLYVEIEVEEDPRFERDGADVVTKVSVSYGEAALGAEIQVPALHDESTHTLAIPAGTQPSSVFTLKGQGIPRLDGRGRGSMVVVVQVEVPAALSDRARELIAELDAELRTCSAGQVSTDRAIGDSEQAARRRVVANK